MTSQLQQAINLARSLSFTEQLELLKTLSTIIQQTHSLEKQTTFVPCTEEGYEHLVELLDSLIDRIGEDERHPLASMMDVIGVLIENYESEHIPELEEVA
ncbi:hypothetical protein [Tychonema sp. BBK16]|uniref:hypothetical protein n=1 Tax=Tychonema sp. BBK16 TaxID=2699888 RepID=UPI001F44D952|nr:hypothetical protein [Tychonema sp. BBK16]MCF6371715.1 hypothetical protein [Tychonema sp. BBK16]